LALLQAKTEKVLGRAAEIAEGKRDLYGMPGSDECVKRRRLLVPGEFVDVEVVLLGGQLACEAVSVRLLCQGIAEIGQRVIENKP